MGRYLSCPRRCIFMSPAAAGGRVRHSNVPSLPACGAACYDVSNPVLLGYLADISTRKDLGFIFLILARVIKSDDRTAATPKGRQVAALSRWSRSIVSIASNTTLGLAG